LKLYALTLGMCLSSAWCSLAFAFVQAYPDSLVCKLADDSAADKSILASSAGERMSIAIDRDPKLFKQVLVTCISNTLGSLFGDQPADAKASDSEASLLWAELDFYGMLPRMEGGQLGGRTMLPAAVLKHESARDAAAKASLCDDKKVLMAKSNTAVASLIVSQLGVLVSRKLLAGAQQTQTLSEDIATRSSGDLVGGDWWKPSEERLGLTHVQSACASDTQQAFVVTTGEDGLPQVVPVDAKPVLPEGCLPPKLLPAELTAPLTEHLEHRLGYTVTVSTIKPTVLPALPQYSLITVSWK
jgi:hypothetical protein